MVCMRIEAAAVEAEAANPSKGKAVAGGSPTSLGKRKEREGAEEEEDEGGVGSRAGGAGPSGVSERVSGGVSEPAGPEQQVDYVGG